MRAARLPRRPLFNDHAEVVELTDDGFEVAANSWAVFRRRGGGFRDRDYSAIGPCSGGNGGDGSVEVGEMQLQLLPPCRHGTKQRSLPHGAGVGISQNDAQSNGVSANHEEGICPLRGVVDINVEALGGQWNLVKLGAFLVPLLCRLVRPMLGVYSVLFHSDNGTLFPMAGSENQR